MYGLDVLLPQGVPLVRHVLSSQGREALAGWPTKNDICRLGVAGISEPLLNATKEHMVAEVRGIRGGRVEVRIHSTDGLKRADTGVGSEKPCCQTSAPGEEIDDAVDGSHCSTTGFQREYARAAMSRSQSCRGIQPRSRRRWSM